MKVIELVLTNSLDCELGRYPVPTDDMGFPLMLAMVADDRELRFALSEMQPGDTLTMVESYNEEVR